MQNNLRFTLVAGNHVIGIQNKNKTIRRRQLIGVTQGIQLPQKLKPAQQLTGRPAEKARMAVVIRPKQTKGVSWKCKPPEKPVLMRSTGHKNQPCVIYS